MKLLLLVIALLTPVWGQSYSATQAVSPSSAAVVVTLQQPATPHRLVVGNSVTVFSTATLTFTLERNGTAATATTLVPKAVNPSETAAETVAFSSSNVGVGTVLGNYQVGAGGSVTIDLSKITFNPYIKGQNLSVRTSSVTGDVAVEFVWEEKSL